MKCYELTTIPSSPSPCANWWEEIEELGVKMDLERKRGWWEGAFSFVLISNYSHLLLISNKLNYFPQVKTVLL